MRKAFKSLFRRLITETHGVLLLFRRCRNMQSAPDTKHDLFLLLSNASQPPPKQLESFVDQLRNVCHQLEQVCAVSALFPLGAHSEAGGNRALQQGLTGLQWWQGIKQCQGLWRHSQFSLLTWFWLQLKPFISCSAVSRGIKDNLIAREGTSLAGQL